MKKGKSSNSDNQTTDVAAQDPCPCRAEYLRAGQIARSAGNKSPLIDISLATWWRWVSAGLAPPAIRLSAGTTVWRKSEVLAFIEARHGK